MRNRLVRILGTVAVLLMGCTAAWADYPSVVFRSTSSAVYSSSPRTGIYMQSSASIKSYGGGSAVSVGWQNPSPRTAQTLPFVPMTSTLSSIKLHHNTALAAAGADNPVVMHRANHYGQGGWEYIGDGDEKTDTDEDNWWYEADKDLGDVGNRIPIGNPFWPMLLFVFGWLMRMIRKQYRNANCEIATR